MIRLSNDWVILVSEIEYALARDEHKKIIQNEKEIDSFKVVGHYGTLKAAMWGYREALIRARLKDDVTPIDEAIYEIKVIDSHIGEAFSKAFGYELELGGKHDE